MDVTYDLYKELDLDRSWDEATIKTRLKEIQRLWTKRQSACNDKEQLLLIDQILAKVDEGFRYLIKAVRREKYDEALNKAYKAGKIKDVIEAQMKSLIEQARQYYRRGNLKLAAQCVQEAIEGKVNDPSAYELLARCHYDMQDYPKALGAIDAGTSIFTDNLNLHWFGARIAAVGMRDYEDAQNRVNKLLELAPDNSLGHSEQVFLHLQKGEEDLAFQEIDSYVAAHPQDEGFRRGVAYDIDSYSNGCYYYDQAQNATFIADKEAYKKCLKLRTKAAEIYSDEHTQTQLENAKYFGKKEWDSWNIESIKSLSIYGGVLLFLFLPIGLILLLIDAMVIYFSYRPYWQINKTYVTGKRGRAERIVTIIGEYAARFGVRFFNWLIQFIWNAILAIGRLIIWLATGGPFK